MRQDGSPFSLRWVIILKKVDETEDIPLAENPCLLDKNTRVGWYLNGCHDDEVPCESLRRWA